MSMTGMTVGSNEKQTNDDQIDVDGKFNMVNPLCFDRIDLILIKKKKLA